MIVGVQCREGLGTRNSSQEAGFGLVAMRVSMSPIDVGSWDLQNQPSGDWPSKC